MCRCPARLPRAGGGQSRPRRTLIRPAPQRPPSLPRSPPTTTPDARSNRRSRTPRPRTRRPYPSARSRRPRPGRAHCMGCVDGRPSHCPKHTVFTGREPDAEAGTPRGQSGHRQRHQGEQDPRQVLAGLGATTAGALDRCTIAWSLLQGPRPLRRRDDHHRQDQGDRHRKRHPDGESRGPVLSRRRRTNCFRGHL